jgi:hypothetical protein
MSDAPKLLDQIVNKDFNAAKSTFDSMLMNKIGERLDTMKSDTATKIFNTVSK